MNKRFLFKSHGSYDIAERGLEAGISESPFHFPCLNQTISTSHTMSVLSQCLEHIFSYCSPRITFWVTPLDQPSCSPQEPPVCTKLGLVTCIVVVQSLSRVRLFATPWTAVHQLSLSLTVFQGLLKLLSTELGMSSNHLILCHPLLLLPSGVYVHYFCCSFFSHLEYIYQGYVVPYNELEVT